jgi:Tol biopolymer transport system component
MDAKTQMTWYDQRGKLLGLAGEPYDYQSGPSLSPHEERIAISRYDGPGVHIWVSELARGVNTRLTFDVGIHSAPVWSPDGNHVAFSSAGSGRYELYQKSSNGTGTENLLFESEENKFPTSWSRDGRFLLYNSQNSRTGWDVWALPMAGAAAVKSGKPFAVAKTEFAELSGVFAPDGHWISYASNESGKNEVWVQQFTPPAEDGSLPAAEKFIVSRGGGTRSSWRADGKELYYATPEGKMMSVAMTTSPVFRAGIPQFLFQMPANAPSWDASADGKRFLVAVPVNESSIAPFNVVLNWRSLMKK